MNGLSLGLLSIGLLVVAVIIWFRRMNDVALEGRRGMLFGMCVVAMGLGVASLNNEPGILGATGAVLGITGAVIWLGLGVFASQSGQAPNIAVGSPLPAFSAPDHQDEMFDIESLRGHPVLIKLFRGHW